MKTIRKIIAYILVFIIMLISSTEKNTLANGSINSNYRKKVNVAVIFHKIDDPYTSRLRKSLENLEKDSTKNVKFTFFDSKNNIAIQNEILDSAVKSNFDLFILNSSDKREEAVKNIINTIKSTEIPAILMNIPPDVAGKVSNIYNKVVFATPDSKLAGIKQGNLIVDLWNGNKKSIDKNGDNTLQYILLQGKSDDTQAIERTKYAISAINSAGIKTAQLALIDAGWEEELAQSAINNLFLKFSGNIEAIISNNDAMAIGAIKALQKYGYNSGDLSKQIPIVGVDGLPVALDLIDKGIMTGTIIQNPDIAAEMFYTVGMNLINNLNPMQNTNYKSTDGEIIVPYTYDIYLGKSNNTLN